MTLKELLLGLTIGTVVGVSIGVTTALALKPKIYTTRECIDEVEHHYSLTSSIQIEMALALMCPLYGNHPNLVEKELDSQPTDEGTI